MAKLRILTFSSLYPNAAMPGHGQFVEHRLRKLVDSGEAEARVVAPVPWFPFPSDRFGSYGRFARAPREEIRHGIPVLHPRFFVIPKLGMRVGPASMAATALPVLRRAIADGYDFDIIDAHYFYPDGVAAARIARRLGKPIVITARGSDLNLLPQYRFPRRMIQEAAASADGLVTVSRALQAKLCELGVRESRVTVLRNGVDLQLFRPVERAPIRRELGIRDDQRLLISAGMLIDTKGHDVPIRALRHLPDVHLLIAGEGEKERFLKSLADSEKVADRVIFLGSLPQERLRDYFGAADALVLASSREGMANVLLESMACGTPVIATKVGGTPEVVTVSEAGVLMEDRGGGAFVDAYRVLMANYPDRAATRKHAETFSWDATTQGQLDLMRNVLRHREGRT